MKYKIGDKVKIVACKYDHGFDIGEVVVITEITDEGSYRGEYLDGHDFWYVEDDEIEPVSPLITRPHDYTGCDPEIAEALKQGLDVYCEVWDDDEDPKLGEWLTQYLPSRTCRYWGEGMYWKHARPISQEPVQETKPKTKLVPKPASEIFAWLENPENGYKQTVDGKFWEKENEPTFTENMVKYCGKDSLAGYDWHPAWLREVPVPVPVAEPEPISEVSENSQQSYKVGDEVEVTVEKWCHVYKLGDRVEIILKVDDGDYKCQRLSDGYVQWLAPEYFKPVPKVQTAIVLEHKEAHLHPGNKVTIIRQDEDGDYLCEWGSGIRIWMQPYQLKFD